MPPQAHVTPFHKLFESAAPHGGRPRIDSILNLCREWLGMDTAVVCSIADGFNTILHIDSSISPLKPQQKVPSHSTYGHYIEEVNDMVAFHDIKGTPYEGAECHKLYKKNAIIGVPLYTEGRYVGTLVFSSDVARAEPFSEAERTMVALAAVCIGQILAQAEMMEAMAQREERWKLALEAAEIGAWDCNVQTWQTAWDERWARMLGYSVEETVHVADWWLERVHPDDRPIVDEAMAAHLRGDMEVYDVEHRVRHKDGHYVWIHDRGRILTYDADGKPLRASGTHIDISARKKAEAEREEMIRQLQESNRQLDEYAHTIAHDLQQPLAVIGGYMENLEIIMEQGRMPDEAQMRRCVETCRSAAMGMSKSIAYLLEFASATRPSARRDAVDTADMVRAVAGMMPYMYPYTDNVIDVTTELPVVTYDRVQMERVFANLIGNAVKYARDGRVHVKIDARRDGDFWVFGVTDDGAGVEDELKARVFDVFARGRATGDKPGHGLGLAICRKIVEDHGGRIGVEDAPGGGSRFYFTVPVKE